MRLNRGGGALVSALGLVFLLGCSSKEGTVSGTIKVNGELVESGGIKFMPADGQASITGGMIENGRYSVRVPVGKMKVAITVPKVVGKKKVYNTPTSPEMPVTAERLPARYNDKTELDIDVKPGNNPKDWDLKEP